MYEGISEAAAQGLVEVAFGISAIAALVAACYVMHRGVQFLLGMLHQRSEDAQEAREQAAVSAAVASLGPVVSGKGEAQPQFGNDVAAYYAWEKSEREKSAADADNWYQDADGDLVRKPGK